MSLTLSDLLAPQVILDTISRIRVGQGRLGSWLGWHYNAFGTDGGGLAGPNTRESPMRSGTYRIMDVTRTAAQGRAPGTGPGYVAPQPMGEMPYTCARFHEKMRLEAERLSAMSSVIRGNTVIDAGGQDYIKRQQTHLAMRFNNAVELMAAGMIRGKFYFRQSGESLYPCIAVPSAPYVTIDLGVPAGNQGQLDMLGAGAIIATSWGSAAAPIISHDLPMIVDAYSQLTGFQVMDAWLGPLTWAKVITNTEVINAAGSSMTPFLEYGWTDPQKGTDAGMVAVLRGYPQIRWHITSEVLVDNNGTDPTYSLGTGTRTPVIPANSVAFMPPPDADWQTLIHFGEPVSDKPGSPMVKRPGFYAWSEWITQPTACEIIGLLNAIPELTIPRAMALATVIFP